MCQYLSIYLFIVERKMLEIINVSILGDLLGIIWIYNFILSDIDDIFLNFFLLKINF